MIFSRFSIVLLLAATLASAQRAVAAVSLEDRAKITSAEKAMSRAGQLYKAKKYPEAAEAISEAQRTIAGLHSGSNLQEIAPLTAKVRSQLTKAHAMLKAKNVQLEPLAFDEPAPPAAMPQPTPKPAPGPAPPKGVPVSFAKQVAPLILGSCTGCHVTAAKGELSMASFSALMKGSKNGAVLEPGNGTNSRIVEVLQSGDMPRGGRKLSSEQVQLIATWIDQGAKFDGPQPGAALRSYASAPVATRPPKLEIVKATGSEQVRFARDIGPLLVAHCVQCHRGPDPKAGLGMDSFARFMQGGRLGNPLVPGKPTDSLLVNKLRGTAGLRMPEGKPPLPAATIAKFEKWVAEGATFDGADPNVPLEHTVAAAAKSVNTDELNKTRLELADRNWRLAAPDNKAQRVETDQFLVLGNVPQETLTEVAQTAEKQVSTVRKMMRVPADEPFIKGRITIYVFAEPYDYTEFGTMVERRELAARSRGHWTYNAVDAYLCMLEPREKQDKLASLLGQQLAGLYVAAQGPVPRWFAEGSGRAIAERIDAKDARIRQWHDRTTEILESGVSPDAFMSTTIAQEDADVLSFGFVKFLMGNSPRYHALVGAVRAGEPFNTALARNFGGTPSQLALAWSARAHSKRR